MGGEIGNGPKAFGMADVVLEGREGGTSGP